METDDSLAARLGTAIAKARHARGWSQDQLAERLDTSKNHVGFLERGERLPSVGMLVRAARALGISLDDVFLDRAGDRQAASELSAIVTSIHPELRPLVITFLRAAAGRAPGRPTKRRS